MAILGVIVDLIGKAAALASAGSAYASTPH
ncbi:hypothetical protein NS506_02343 [Nocardia seriolae]|uniref:Uncharacterized protein n=1 Tax=Nocardia seriolae TaxID=37332 RepID=A0ABC8AQS9_9NOCA|nr:hypothetical protein NS506_02343 [Nocardia seriolae]